MPKLEDFFTTAEETKGSIKDKVRPTPYDVWDPAQDGRNGVYRGPIDEDGNPLL